jgi:hypothetical protein
VGVSEIDRNRLPGEDAEPLPADARMRWDAFKSAVGELAAATDDTAGLEAAVRAVQQIMRGLDAEQYADALDVPEDAGEFADGLRGILMRIPDGWGRWISCERGWYQLLTELDGGLAGLLPRYRIHQVKEKFAGLRFYWDSGERIVDPNDPEPTVVGEAAGPTEQTRLLADHEAWQRRLSAYLETPEGRARQEDLDRRIEFAERLVKRAAALAARTCERCGEPGECCQRRNGAWYKTLCGTCADAAGYEPVPDDDDD